jgi:hypothetical protein
MKYLKGGEKGKRTGKSNLTKGATGIHRVNVESFKVIQKHLRTSETCNECGVAGRKIAFVPKIKPQIARATKKGAIPSVYKPYKSHNKYTPNSKGKVHV